MTQQADIIVAGHICLDVIPTFPNVGAQAKSTWLQPGSLTRVGGAVCSTGGAVANVGLALHRLGVAVKLIGKLGDDMFGRQIRECIQSADAGLADGLRCVPGETTSYTIVINPPASDRFFLHCPGANDTFSSSDVCADSLRGAKILHFGYPPIMKVIYRDDGAELVKIFSLAKQNGLTTSLDMASIDPASEAGSVDWRRYLGNVLSHTDVFLPSMEELLYMLDRPLWQKLVSNGGALADHVSRSLLQKLADDLIQLGAAVVVIKLGNQGLYLQTSGDVERLKKCAVLADRAPQWAGQQILEPCLDAVVVGTTGSGDCTIAGFLAALVHGQLPQNAATAAVATGACSVEKLDAVSGVPSWSEIQKRIAAGWARCTCDIR